MKGLIKILFNIVLCWGFMKKCFNVYLSWSWELIFFVLKDCMCYNIFFVFKFKVKIKVLMRVIIIKLKIVEIILKKGM